MNWSGIARRLYANFIMPSRIHVYRAFLQRALANGYSTHTLIGFRGLIERSELRPEGRYLLLRHDIDMNPTMARKLWELEVSLGVVSSYYFRLQTLDTRLMRDIAQYGGEASYHCEEIATVAKKLGLSTAQEVRGHMPEMREAFRRNLARLRNMTGLPMESVASHGDFVNRRVGVTNCEILACPEVRRRTGVVLEAYDADFKRHMTGFFADDIWPGLWNGGDPMRAVTEGMPVVHVLIHPCHWGTSAWWSGEAVLFRARDELRYAVGVRLRHGKRSQGRKD